MNNIRDTRDYLQEVAECCFYYIEQHMSLKDVSRETCLSKDTVKRRLESLADYDREAYEEYLAEKRKRHAGRKQGNNKRST